MIALFGLLGLALAGAALLPPDVLGTESGLPEDDESQAGKTVPLDTALGYGNDEGSDGEPADLPRDSAATNASRTASTPSAPPQRLSEMGTDMPDVIFGSEDEDDVRAGAGADHVDLRDGDDRAHGGAQDDEMHGGRGGDTLWGGDGDDRLWGHVGDDVIQGGAGNDRLQGGDGADALWGSAGDDALSGVWAMTGSTAGPAATCCMAAPVMTVWSARATGRVIGSTAVTAWTRSISGRATWRMAAWRAIFSRCAAPRQAKRR
ncbi:hemolysin-type calcium binding protein [Limimaricola cinnabarinus LL-001]|uniref:Hemolysin-type calcium binding protein n=1 Tax=Limimaricola cinnabarinus LL-001 TaxID=1337093 RepID=U3A903_9RHOB|nr:calcium-binding protein [Limimaricola cinnabarinus]GAD54159.1 hemolysin-type calcium binding protein [Limimaricola cinnabarinus LL-001]